MFIYRRPFFINIIWTDSDKFRIMFIMFKDWWELTTKISSFLIAERHRWKWNSRPGMLFSCFVVVVIVIVDLPQRHKTQKYWDKHWITTISICKNISFQCIECYEPLNSRFFYFDSILSGFFKKICTAILVNFNMSFKLTIFNNHIENLYYSLNKCGAIFFQMSCKA